MPQPRKHDKLHVLQGTKPHDRNPEMTPGTLVAGRPKFPKSLSGEAKRVFKQLCRQLAERRALTEGDGHLLILYATIWDRRARAQEKLIEQGEVVAYTRIDPNGVAHKIEKANLHLKIASDAERQLVSILDRLGLSPLAGSKIKQTRAASDEKTEPEEGTVSWIIAQHLAEKKRIDHDNSLPA
jgi:P27 family predicted phage terminase small subunit